MSEPAQPRPYQQEALDALHAHVCTKSTNPCVVLPTGSGKSLVIAWAIQRWKLDHPPLRVIILAHRKELVAQNSAELAEAWPGADIGIYSAGLHRRDTDNSIIYASIDSVHRKGGDFSPFDLAIVDECFVAGTLVSTPAGDMPIESLSPGDTVFTAMGVELVGDVFVRKSSNLVDVEISNGTRIRCTRNHPFFTDSGWREAGSLEVGARLYDHQAVRALRKTIPSVDKTESRRVDTQPHQGEAVARDTFLLGLLRQESRKPDVQRKASEKDEIDVTENWPQTPTAGRKREAGTDPCGRPTWGIGYWVAPRASGANQNQEGAGLPNLLQGGHSQPGTPDSDRGGRAITRTKKSEGSRSEKREAAGELRVAGVTPVESGGPRPVFNLQIGGHPSYYANGVLVHNCHRIPPSGEGKYRTFLELQRIQNKNLRILGFTATPFRMTGPLCHPDHLLQEICYEANIFSLIQDGYLCKLWSRRGEHQPDLSQVKRNHGGDYVVESLAKAVDNKDVIRQAVHDAMQHIRAFGRKHTIWFCVDVEHCQHVSQELRMHGINAPAITASTPHQVRDRVAREFKKGQLSAICNVNVYTEGFNAKQVDCIVLLRPTLSKGLYQQMVGRALRVHPSKADALILDYAHCIDEHGPIDAIGAGDAPTADCRKCGNVFSRQVRKCPHCGWEIPKPEIEKMEAEERERRLHEIRASDRAILSGAPEELPVEEVRVHRHTKAGMPDSLRVEYRCGLCVTREWVCLDHVGIAGNKAKFWWKQRFNEPAPTVNGALENLFLANQIKDVTRSIVVAQRGKYREIVKHNLKEGVLK